MLPTFSPAGWVRSPLERVDFMLAYFFETQKSQSHYHKNKITSYQSLIADAKSPAQLESEIQIYLGDYLATQFQKVELNVEVKGAFGEADNNQLVVEIGCTFMANGIQYDISHAVELLGTHVKRIHRINEIGETT